MGQTQGLLQKPQKDKNTDVGNIPAKLTYSASGIQGWRAFQEDARLTIEAVNGNENISLFGVFDGHGGPEVARYVSEYFAEELTKNQSFIAKDYKTSLEETFLEIDKKLRSEEGQRIVRNYAVETAKDNPFEEKGTVAETRGCTSTVLLIVDDTLYLANAGDGRAIIWYFDDEERMMNVRQITEDHKPGVFLEEERIRKAGGEIDENGRVNGDLNLSRALGDLRYKDVNKLPEEQIISPFPDIFELDIKKDKINFLLLGCDGIYERKSNEQIMNMITQKGKNKTELELKATTEFLLDELLSKDPNEEEGKGCDNMTCILIRFNLSQLVQEKK